MSLKTTYILKPYY